MAEEKSKITEMDAQTLRHLEARMNDTRKMLALSAEGLDVRTIAGRLRVAESYVQHVIDVGDLNKLQDEALEMYEAPHLKEVISKAKAKIAEVREKEPVKVGTAYPGKKIDKPAPVAKPPKAEKKKTDTKPAKASGGVMNSRNVAILDILKASKTGMTKEVIGKAVNTKLGINRASWDTPMYELKKAGLITFDAATKLYNVA